MKYFFLCCCSIFFFTACEIIDITSVEDVKFEDNPTFAFPLLFSDVDIKTILEDTSNFRIETGENDILTFKFTADERIITNDSIFTGADFPNTTDNPALVFINPIEQDFPAADGQDIDSVVLSQGNFSITYTLAGTPGDTIDFYFFVDGLSLNGAPLELRTQQVFEAGDTPETNTRPYDLANYALFPNESDKVVIGFEAKRNGVVDATVVPSITFTLNNLDYSAVHGYFGEEQISILEDSVSFDFFDRFIDADYSFKEPRILMRYENYFGLPMSAIFTDFFSENRDGSITNLTGSALTEAPTLNYPTLDNIGEFETGALEFNAENSTITDLIESNPQKIKIVVDGLPNPERDSSIRGFLTKDSRLNIITDVEVPLIGNLRQLVAYDTIEAIDDIDQSILENYREGKLQLSTSNEIPVGADCQVFLVGANGQVLDSLLTTDVQIAPATVDQAGLVTSTTEGTVDIPISKQQLETIINDTKEYIIRFKIYSNQSAPNVVIKSSQKLEAKLGLLINLNL